MARIRPSSVVLRVSVNVNRAESPPAGTVTSKIGAVPARSWKVPFTRSVQSVRVSGARTGVRFPKGS